MELEVPDEAESAEAGAVTAEAAWSAESGAAAGKCYPPVAAMGSPLSPAVVRGLARPLRAAMRPAGSIHSHARRGDARALPLHERGRGHPRAGRLHRPARGCGARSARPILGFLDDTMEPQAGVGAALYPGSLCMQRTSFRCMR